MTPDLLREAGIALYGSRWQSELARDLGVAVRTVQRWDAADRGVPSGLAGELRELLKARGAALAIVRRKLPRQTAANP